MARSRAPPRHAPEKNMAKSLGATHWQLSSALGVYIPPPAVHPSSRTSPSVLGIPLGAGEGSRGGRGTREEMGLGRRWRGVPGGAVVVAAAVALMQIVSLVHPTSAQQSNGTPRVLPAEGYCSMYGICANQTDGKVLNCVNATKAVKPDTLFSTKIQSLCPTITGDVCCTVDQFDTLHQQVQQAIPFLVGCPACLRNFLNLFCEMSCSPNQSLFINVTSVKQVNNITTVDGIDYYITRNYGEELYNSCKEVKFGTLNTRAMDFLGGGAKTYKGLMAEGDREIMERGAKMLKTSTSAMMRICAAPRE